MSSVTRTTLAIEKELLESFDGWMAERGYANRSKAIRDLIRSALVESEWENPNRKVVAVLSIVYNHDAHDLAQELTGIQHEDHHAVICSQHVHLTHHRCLEVLLMQGRAGQLRRLSDGIIATRGVRAGKLVLLSDRV